MTDEVKFIFKSLLKVPIMIMVSYAILNIFAFFFIYFKALGTSYVVMQTAVENNYLPPAELTQLYDYVNSWNSIRMVENAGIVVYDPNPNNDVATIDSSNTEAEYKLMGAIDDTNAQYGPNDARTRKQYGGTVTCGVACDYVFIWPLSHRETLEGADLDSAGTDTTGVNGVSGTNSTSFKNSTDLEAMRESKRSPFRIKLTYTVPGLRYYPDMLTY